LRRWYCELHELGISYRCSIAILAEAGRLFPVPAAAPSGKHGAPVEHRDAGERIEGMVQSLHAEGIEYRDIAILARTHEDLRGIAEDLDCPHIVQERASMKVTADDRFTSALRDLARHERAIVEREDLEEAVEALAHQIDPSPSCFARAWQAIPYGIREVAQAAAWRDESEIADVPGDAVRLMTIHAAKGLEWRAAILLDWRREGGEENRVRYVGITRASERLAIVH